MTDEEPKKIDAARQWVERNLGRVMYTILPVAITGLAAWIVNIQGTISELKSKLEEDKAQWSALLASNERITNLEVDTQVNQRLLTLISEHDIPPELLHLERLLKNQQSVEIETKQPLPAKEPDQPAPRNPEHVTEPKYGSAPSAPAAPRHIGPRKHSALVIKPLLPIKPREERLDDFRQKHLDYVQQTPMKE